jgi:hypothetical protein
VEVYGLQNNAYVRLKTIKFVYSYFKDNAGTADIRLKLDEVQVQVQVQDRNRAVQERYAFQY